MIGKSEGENGWWEKEELPEWTPIASIELPRSARRSETVRKAYGRPTVMESQVNLLIVVLTIRQLVAKRKHR